MRSLIDGWVTSGPGEEIIADQGPSAEPAWLVSKTTATYLVEVGICPLALRGCPHDVGSPASCNGEMTEAKCGEKCRDKQGSR